MFNNMKYQSNAMSEREKRQMYNKIMESVSKKVLAVLNESFEFEKDDLGDALVAVINKNEAIMKVVKNAELRDYIELVQEMQDIIQNDPKALKSIPNRITNLHSLAVKILASADKKALKPFMVLKGAELQSLAEYMKEVVAGGEQSENTPKAIAQRQDMQPAVESKSVKECGDNCQCKDGECKDGKCEEGCGCKGKECKEEKVCPKCGKNPCVCGKKEVKESWEAFAAKARRRYL